MSEKPDLRFAFGESELTIELNSSLKTAFIDASAPSDARFKPQLVANAKDSGADLLSSIKRQLSTCRSFDFCVAFISDEALQMLVALFSELSRLGIKGRFLTSTYLNFNSPSALRKLLTYSSIEVRVYQGSMHAKGYIFDHGETSTFIIGSSNLTASALTCNREWNVVLHSLEHGEMLERVREEFNALWDDTETVPLTEEWIGRYEAYRHAEAAPVKRKRSFVASDETGLGDEIQTGKISPNAMQHDALRHLSDLHARNEPRALLVSATGTGKTYLSAFDVDAVRPARVLFLAHRKRILEASLASYRRLLGNRYTYGIYGDTASSYSATCMFAMCSTIARHLDEFDPNWFDYIVIDEAHRTGAQGYQRIMEHFAPKFYLGMTATPNRTDGFDVFGLFNHVIAYQITLQDALENDMLAPFHYFGIADLQIDYLEQDDYKLFSKLTSDARVEHVIQKIEEYSVEKDHRRGLIFCSRNEEARDLSEKFNARGYRTCAISGENTSEERNRAISRLESGELQYIFSVDILNEGVDIPTVNQIIMLRCTESAIVFVQQLGRGLRKADGKEYALVLDFIGNYQKNFLVPVALSGDKTYNKDRLRRIVKEGSAMIPGRSTVSFDRISEARIYRAIDGGDFTATKFLKEEYQSLRQMLGRIPSLADFDRNGSIDPLLIFQKFGSYHAFLSKYEKSYDVSFTQRQSNILKFVSQKLANGKRLEELALIRQILNDHRIDSTELVRADAPVNGRDLEAAALESAFGVLAGTFAASKDFVPLVQRVNGKWVADDDLLEAVQDVEFARQLCEVVDFAIARNERFYAQPYRDTGFVLNAKYTYEEVCRILNWSKNLNAQNIGGYKYDRETNTFPVFINYDKSPDISDSIKYEDRFVSENELIAISKQPRNLSSPEIERLRNWPANGMKTYLFVRKNKEDEGSKEFYFFGEMYPTGQFNQIMMPGVEKSAVEITYRLRDPVRSDLYEFMLSDLSDDEAA